MLSKLFLLGLISVPFLSYQCDTSSRVRREKMTGQNVLLLTHCIYQFEFSLYIPFPKWDKNTWDKLLSQVSLRILNSSSLKALQIPFALWADVNILLYSQLGCVSSLTGIVTINNTAV